ncbi:MAG: DUF1446 domain-containing protein [Betaproteobacteria bacterium]|nr:DUF1446 domain-containing protein [Betaproteobacteria bacterium]
MKNMIRIANAGGYWGDDPYALRRQVCGPLNLDYISIDFLAEITMSILQKQRQKDPKLGYAGDFVTQLAPLLKTCKDRGIKIITNAGGVNPRACADALFELARKEGVDLRVAIVEGDDIAERLPQLVKQPGCAMKNMETGEDFDGVLSRVLSANVYFGAMPVVEALRSKPDIVICGRVTDTGITLAAMIHEFGWKADDYDKLSHGIVAGHIIECGAQATGGNFTDWKKVQSFEDVGFPILECSPDGSFIVTKHPGSGGLVSVQTLREQLLYEMGHPQSYITPDVIADFTTIALAQAGDDRVRVSGVKGRPPTDLLKVSVAYADGYKANGTLIVSGPDARAKAEVFSKIMWQKLSAELTRAGLPPCRKTMTEYIGDDSTHRALAPAHAAKEVLVRFGALADEKASLQVFRKILPSLILSGPSGVAVTGGAPSISDVVSYWPALIPQEVALARVWVGEVKVNRPDPCSVAQSSELAWPKTGGSAEITVAPSDPHRLNPTATGKTRKLPLWAIAHARSGDKGDTANIGLIGRSPECYAWLRENVSAELVKNWFASICQGQVTRHVVPNLWALNFLLEETLDGGGTMSLCIDAQGKTLSQALLRCEMEIPLGLFASIDTLHAASNSEIFVTASFPGV